MQILVISDTIIMGRKTYEQILTLSPKEFPYKGKKCYVFSRSLTGYNEFVHFIHEAMLMDVRRYKQFAELQYIIKEK